ncbi:unnamed protein product [Allacma fusca]|uniref:G-protein coupled receptors family 1 profile domain-containing protein n=1 Tax=Allacma fusca TaxID=39272 RepID=A0A8J2KHS8_9HEXA|nr:unnamed protein product [Allacma fusca]
MRLAYNGPVLCMSVLTTGMLIHVIRTAKDSNNRHPNVHQLYKRAALTYTIFYVTFTVGLIPLAVVQIVLCDNCFISTEKVSVQTICWVAMVTQSLQLLAMLCNPVFYSWRNKQVQTGLWRMSIDMALFMFSCCLSDDRVMDLQSRRQVPNRTAQREALNFSITAPASSPRRECSPLIQQTSFLITPKRMCFKTITNTLQICVLMEPISKRFKTF